MPWSLYKFLKIFHLLKRFFNLKILTAYEHVQPFFLWHSSLTFAVSSSGTHGSLTRLVRHLPGRFFPLSFTANIIQKLNTFASLNRPLLLIWGSWFESLAPCKLHLVTRENRLNAQKLILKCRLDSTSLWTLSRKSSDFLEDLSCLFLTPNLTAVTKADSGSKGLSNLKEKERFLLNLSEFFSENSKVLKSEHWKSGQVIATLANYQESH